MTLSHAEFIATLPPDQRRALMVRSDAAGLRHLAGHFGAIGALGLWVGIGAPGWQLALLPLGIAIIFLFTLLHETVHLTPFASPRLNRIVGAICGFLVGLPPLWFRYFHLAHHKYTNDPERDPELSAPKPESPWRYALHVSGLPVWASQAWQLVRNAIGRFDEPYLPASAHGRMQREAIVMLLLYLIALALILLGQTWILWCWIIPALLGQPFLRLYLLAEHGRCPPVADMFENTRTTYTSRIIRALAWNMPFHAEHHAMPNVPFHQLPRLGAMTAEHLKSTSPGYVAFHRDFAPDIAGRDAS